MSHLFLAAALSLIPAHAASDPVAHRGDPCERELLDDEDAFERNAWAHTCGYISEASFSALFSQSLWIAFQWPGAPVDLQEPCDHAWGQPVALCPADLD